MIRRPGRPIEGSAVQQDNVRRAGLGKRLGHLALFVALAVVPVLALNSLATATPGSEGGDARPGLTDAQRQCLAEQGVTVPDGSAADGRSALTREQRRELRQAGRACGVRGMRAGRGRSRRCRPTPPRSSSPTPVRC